ncbi:MAG: S8 family serine peptidase [Marmoricola sp.]
MQRILRSLVAVAACCLTVMTLATPGQATTSRATPRNTSRLTATQARAMHAKITSGGAAASTHTLDFCRSHKLHCNAQVLARAGSSTPLSSFTPFGFGATDLESAYGLTGTSGETGTITIVDAGAYPTIESDLNVYRRQYGLPQCLRSTGCLTVRSYNNGPERKTATTELGREIEEAVGVETALDLDMASAACPRCRLLLLQLPPIDAFAPSNQQLRAAEDHFAAAVQTAKSRGASAVSISYGYPTDNYDATGSPAKKMNVTGMAVSASTGDFGYNGLFPPWPQVLPSVIAVGGTELSQSSNGAWHEAVWDATGSGCSAGLTPAAYGQPASISALCNGYRASADLSAVADPQTGVSVYNTYAPASNFPNEWIVVGGTSASSPLVAGMYARAGVPATVHGPNKIYAKSASVFHDIVAGGNAPRGVCSADGVSERLCAADNGWDGPTGRGTPKGLVTFR